MYKQNARRTVARVRAWAIASPVRIIPKCKERIKFVEPFKSHYAPFSASPCNRARSRTIRAHRPPSFLPTNFTTFEDLYLPTARTGTYGIMERNVIGVMTRRNKAVSAGRYARGGEKGVVARGGN